MAHSQSPAQVFAYRSLQRARADLDDVMRTLPEHGGDDAMATPALIDALLRAVAAKRHVDELRVALEREADWPGPS